jgi:hypothetical protein
VQRSCLRGPEALANLSAFNYNLDGSIILAQSDIRFYGGRGLALIMSGTTGELSAALTADIQAGIRSLHIIQDGPVAVWYIRRKAGTFTKTLVSISSLPLYWGLRVDDPRQVSDARGWYQLGVGFPDRVDLTYLRDTLLPYGRQHGAWR